MTVRTAASDFTSLRPAATVPAVPCPWRYPLLRRRPSTPSPNGERRRCRDCRPSRRLRPLGPQRASGGKRLRLQRTSRETPTLEARRPNRRRTSPSPQSRTRLLPLRPKPRFPLLAPPSPTAKAPSSPDPVEDRRPLLPSRRGGSGPNQPSQRSRRLTRCPSSMPPSNCTRPSNPRPPAPTAARPPAPRSAAAASSRCATHPAHPQCPPRRRPSATPLHHASQIRLQGAPILPQQQHHCTRLPRPQPCA